MLNWLGSNTGPRGALEFFPGPKTSQKKAAQSRAARGWWYQWYNESDGGEGGCYSCFFPSLEVIRPRGGVCVRVTLGLF